MIYAVDKYIDRLTKKKKREFWIDRTTPMDHYFDTEEAAKAFIVDRAVKAFEQAQDDVKKAAKRLGRVYVKYGPKDQPNAASGEGK